MDSNAIRRAFTQFFVERDHTQVPSASLIPVDPTLLLTNAGMVPFKPYFLGEEPAPYKRAVSIQKVARTIDIDIVGTTARHLTFFEMMGNFSFGDYFKERAIPWGYEFVTDVLGVDPERLWFTVYETDDEAAEIWIDAVGAPPERVQRGGRDNFWQMGVAGPCGPSSEIFVDRGEAFGEAGGPIGGGEDRFVEVWNLVFMQNIQDEPYHVVGDLPAKNIDTGLGLERMAMVLQEKDSAFETDLMFPVIQAGAEATGTRYGQDEMTDVSLRILGDHGRSLTMLVGDGVVPSNDGRGYVLRRLIRRAVRHAWTRGSETAITPVLVAATVAVMGEAYPHLVQQQDFITEIAEREEHSFRRTLESGHQLLDAELARVDAEAAPVVSGDVAFKLHDTYGFPVELTTEIATERGYEVDLAEFETAMQAQRDRARTAWKGGDEVERAGTYRAVLDATGPTQFLGYDFEESRSRILSILREGEAVDRAEEGQEVELFLDRTPFYAEAGGQVGDTGRIVTESGRVKVTDTQFPLPGLNGHRGKVTAGTIQVGQDAEARIDSALRERIRKSHTGTHVLHWALREVLGHNARQAGSRVEAGRLRFDFSHHQAPAAEELQEVERLANERVIENARVRAFQTSKKEAEKLGALAFFGDKYGDVVRVVEAGDYSRELCGGTHTFTTGQVGPLVVSSEGSIGSNVRRIEALTGSTALQHLLDLRNQLDQTAADLRTPSGKVAGAVRSLLDRVKDQERRLGAFEDQYRAEAAVRLMDQAENLGSATLVAAVVGESGADDLRAIAQQVRERVKSGVVILAAHSDGKGSLVAAVSSDLVESGVDAGGLLGEAAKILGGGAGRDPELAQAGGPHGDRVDEALAVARDRARGALGAL